MKNSFWRILMLLTKRSCVMMQTDMRANYQSNLCCPSCCHNTGGCFLRA